jgi:hypothetical protein
MELFPSSGFAMTARAGRTRAPIRQEIETMPFKHRAVLRLAMLALPGLLISAAATAGDADRNADRTVGLGSHEPIVPPAPIGHRQPRAADLPAVSPKVGSDDWLNRLNRETNRKLQICRGC